MSLTFHRRKAAAADEAETHEPRRTAGHAQAEPVLLRGSAVGGGK